MATVVAFPVGKESEALAYLAWCTQNHPDSPGPWYPNNKFDKYGQQIIAYLGPEGFIYNNQPFPEPEGGEAARADGVLIDNVEWPEEE